MHPAAAEARLPGGKVLYVSGCEAKSDAQNKINHAGLAWFSRMTAAVIGIYTGHFRTSPG